MIAPITISSDAGLLPGQERHVIQEIICSQLAPFHHQVARVRVVLKSVISSKPDWPEEVEATITVFFRSDSRLVRRATRVHRHAAIMAVTDAIKLAVSNRMAIQRWLPLRSGLALMTRLRDWWSPPDAGGRSMVRDAID